ALPISIFGTCDQSSERDLVEAGIGLDGRECRILHRGEVESGIPDLGQKHCHCNLLEASCQMPWHVVVVFHRALLGWRVLTSILIVSILSNIEEGPNTV